MGAKDWLVEKTAPAVLNTTLVRPYGKLTHLKLDSRARLIEMELELNGEEKPIFLQIHDYELVHAGEELSIVVQKVSCSRPWLQKLAEDLVVGKPFAIPKQARTVVSLLL